MFWWHETLSCKGNKEELCQGGKYFSQHWRCGRKSYTYFRSGTKLLFCSQTQRKQSLPCLLVSVSSSLGCLDCRLPLLRLSGRGVWAVDKDLSHRASRHPRLMKSRKLHWRLEVKGIMPLSEQRLALTCQTTSPYLKWVDPDSLAKSLIQQKLKVPMSHRESRRPSEPKRFPFKTPNLPPIICLQ